VTPDPELLGDEPVRLGPVRERDVLDAEPAPLWRPPRWVVAAVLLVAVVATAGWYVDRQERAREARALEGCRLELQDAVAFSDARLSAMADYLDPALGVTRGARHGELADLMAGPARRVLRGVERADRACRAVSIRPWHVALVSRHEATTAYSSALAASLRTIAGEGRAYYRDSSRLQQLREAAAIPVLGGPF
jgi:hypothetical protein